MAVAAIIVEDGSVVAGANSYASVATLRQYATDNGVSTLPADDAAAILLFKAMQYIEAKEPRYQGCRTTETAYNAALQQELSWPRTYVRVANIGVPYNVIPKRLIKAQCQVACDISGGFAVLPTMTTQGGLKKSVIGPITKEYFDPRSGTTLPTTVFAAAEAYLRPLYINSGAVRSNRV